MRLDTNNILFFPSRIIIVLYFSLLRFDYLDIRDTCHDSMLIYFSLFLLGSVVYRQRITFTRMIELLSFLSTNEKLIPFLFRLCLN